MWTTSAVARHVNRLTHGQLFTTRDLLSYGTRSAVDQAVSKLIQLGYMKRLARGVFVRLSGAGVPNVSVTEVALAKAAAFGKQILTWSSDRCHQLLGKGITESQTIFASSGCSSQFRFGNVVIRYKAICGRKFKLGDSKAGRTLRSLWQLGWHLCDAHTVADAVSDFYRSDYEEIVRPATGNLLPSWLRSLFYTQLRIEKRKNKIEREAENYEAQQRLMISNRTSETTLMLQSGMFELTDDGHIVFVVDPDPTPI